MEWLLARLANAFASIKNNFSCKEIYAAKIELLINLPNPRCELFQEKYTSFNYIPASGYCWNDFLVKNIIKQSIRAHYYGISLHQLHTAYLNLVRG